MNTLTICLIIFVLMVIGFCSGKISLATVSLVSMMALVLTGCMDAKDALGYFANNNVIMIGGMCVVAAGFNRTQFCVNIANKISSMANGSLNKMMFGYVLIGMLLSQFIQSPVVAMGIVAPMLAASAESMGIKNSKVMFSLGVITVVTCCTLPVGAGATIAAELNGYIESYGYTEHMVQFLDPMIGRLPMLVIGVIYCAFFATRFAPDEPAVTPSSAAKNEGGAYCFKTVSGICRNFYFLSGCAGADVCAKTWPGKLGGYSDRRAGDGALRGAEAKRGNQCPANGNAAFDRRCAGNVRRVKRYRCRGNDWRAYCGNCGFCKWQFLYRGLYFLYHSIPANAGNAEQGNHADLPSHCNCDMCLYRRKSGRAYDFNPGSMSFCFYDAYGYSSNSLYDGMWRI